MIDPPDRRDETIVVASSQAIRQAAAAIRAGQVVAYPTETCYGLGADALDPNALSRLLNAKQRPASQPIALLIAGREMLAGLVSRVPQQAEQLMRRYWPGPLTLVLPAVDGLPSSLKGPGGGVAVRISSDPVASALVSSVGRPVTSTSANLSGAPPPLGAADAALAGVSLVLDDGPRDRAASTLVAVFDDESPPRVLRQGPVCIGQS